MEVFLALGKMLKFQLMARKFLWLWRWCEVNVARGDFSERKVEMFINFHKEIYGGNVEISWNFLQTFNNFLLTS